MNTTVYADIREMKKYALDNKVPIMQDDGIDFLTTFVVKHQINSVLEIGTAIGYSAIMMALSNPNLKITTIERDRERYLEAVKNVKKFGLENRITLVFHDALEANIEGCFDMIFIDAAKGQNINFFEKYELNLKSDGYIITDNMNFHGLVEHPELSRNRNTRQLVRKIHDYHTYLAELSDYETAFYDYGDGVAITRRK